MLIYQEFLKQKRELAKKVWLDVNREWDSNKNTEYEREHPEEIRKYRERLKVLLLPFRKV